MKFTRLALFVLTVSMLTTDLAQAESKWSWKKLVPTIGKKEEAPRGLYPTADEPSVLKKMTNGTKSMFAKTKQMVPPWLMPQTQDRVRRSGNGLKRSTERVREELRTARRNILAPWTKPAETAEPPKTVPDFLALPKPK